MKLSQIGEFALIDRLARKIRINKKRVKVGIGDDAAVIKTSKDKLLLVTTDTLVENIHFDLKYTSFYKLGYKALSVNISDIAAMGGWPTEALITLGLPNNFRVKDVDEIYSGIEALAKKYKVNIVGGDTVASPKAVIISITLLGEVPKDELLLRSGARVGDLILATGKLGEAAERPRIKEARVIAGSKLATSMIDSSDGLSRSLIEICKMSKVGARIWLKALSKPYKLALNGGEEYELIFTAPKKTAAKLIQLIKSNTGTSVTAIGEITSKKHGITVLGLDGKETALKYKGYEHFKKQQA